MSRIVRIALLALVLTSLAGAGFALSNTPDMAPLTDASAVSKYCISSGEFCNLPSDCDDLEGFVTVCEFSQCGYCPER